MGTEQLTKKQRLLLSELVEIADVLAVDWQKISDYERDSRTLHLERMKRHIIIGEVIMQYTLINEYLDIVLCDYFFGRKSDFSRLWKTKRFRNFNYHVLEGLSLLKKLAFAESISSIPKPVANDVRKINALRNGLAHALFPENLRNSKPIYKGKNIFTADGIKRFVEDMARVSQVFRRL